MTPTRAYLEEVGKILVKNVIYEARKDFAKRKWSVRDPGGGPDLAESFTYKILKDKVEVYSSFYGLGDLVNQDIPPHKITWLTQESKKKHPERYNLSQTEMKRGKRGPLIVPLKIKGNLIFRLAPKGKADAWVHPGVEKFTFPYRALKRSREEIRRLGL